MAPTAKPRPVYRNIHVSQIVSYRLPPAGIVSILHRVSGALMFLLLPFVIWLFDVGFVPAVLVKLVVLTLIWAYLHHFIAGVRHLWMDATHSVTKEQGHSSAVLTLGLSVVLTVALGAKLFGLY